MSSDQDNMPRPPTFVDPATARGYELTGKIMMSAIIIVFAIVVVMVILHIYARWYIIRNHRRRRRTQLVFYVDPNSASAAESRGLDPSLLKSLPTFVFSENEQALECAVCLSEFEKGEEARLLPNCNHSFHVDCIDMWFHSHSTCPLCRTTVDAELTNGIDAVDIVLKMPQSNPTHSEPGPSSSSSFGARRKGLDLVGVSVEVPARTASFSFANSEEVSLSSPAGQGLKSPASRLLSFRRKLSREKKPIPSPSGIGTSCADWADIEDGRVETRTSWSRATTPR